MKLDTHLAGIVALTITRNVTDFASYKTKKTKRKKDALCSSRRQVRFVDRSFRRLVHFVDKSFRQKVRFVNNVLKYIVVSFVKVRNALDDTYIYVLVVYKRIWKDHS